MADTLRLLDVSGQFQDARGAYHLAYYIPGSMDDRITHFLTGFRQGREPQTTQWIRLAALLISQTLSIDVIVRALGSKERTPDGSAPLDKLGVAVARKSGARYAPECLSKNAQTPRLRDPGEVRDRTKELGDAYLFTDPGLGASPRILLIDDVITTGSTLNSICAAIKRSVPQADVFYFALARTDPSASNAHLDASYFEKVTSPVVGPTQKGKEGDEDAMKTTKKSSGMETRKTTEAPKKRAPAPVPAAAPAASGRRPVPHAAPEKKSLGTSAAIFGVTVTVLCGALLLFATKPSANIPTSVPNYATAVESSVAREPRPVKAPVEPKPQVQKSQFPEGLVTVPSAGLRTGHSLDAKSQRAKVRKGERVEILRRVSPDTGPSWVQIRTVSGKTGWVWASVVKELSAGRRVQQD